MIHGILFLSALLLSCTSISQISPSKDDERISVSFELELNQDVYLKCAFGDPPQLVVWMEHVRGDDSCPHGGVRTLWVSRAMGQGIWKGKVKCDSCLPFWISRLKNDPKIKELPSFRYPLPDAISRATPKNRVTFEAELPCKHDRRYFIEVNIAADYNAEFSHLIQNSWPDPDGNGQPSLVYDGIIEIEPLQIGKPELRGRTLQVGTCDGLTLDTKGITTAFSIFLNISIAEAVHKD